MGYSPVPPVGVQLRWLECTPDECEVEFNTAQAHIVKLIARFELWLRGGLFFGEAAL